MPYLKYITEFIPRLAIHRAYSCIFHSCDLLPHFPFLHFQSPRFLFSFNNATFPDLVIPALYILRDNYIVL